MPPANWTNWAHLVGPRVLKLTHLFWLCAYQSGMATEIMSHEPYNKLLILNHFQMWHNCHYWVVDFFFIVHYLAKNYSVRALNSRTLIAKYVIAPHNAIETLITRMVVQNKVKFSTLRFSVIFCSRNVWVGSSFDRQGADLSVVSSPLFDQQTQALSGLIQSIIYFYKLNWSLVLVFYMFISLKGTQQWTSILNQIKISLNEPTKWNRHYPLWAKYS